MSRLRSGLANDRRRYGCYCAPSAFNIGVISGPGSLYSGKNFDHLRSNLLYTYFLDCCIVQIQFNQFFVILCIFVHF